MALTTTTTATAALPSLHHADPVRFPMSAKKPPVEIDLQPGFAVQGEDLELLHPDDNPHTVSHDFGQQLLASGRAVPHDPRAAARVAAAKAAEKAAAAKAGGKGAPATTSGDPATTTR